MHISIENLGTAPLPITSKGNGGWAKSVDAGGTVLLDQPESEVITIGVDKPWIDDLKTSLGEVVAGVLDVIEFWKEKKPVEEKELMVRLRLTNEGTSRSIRVVLGDRTNDFILAPGLTQVAVAVEYVELRELGG
jgi:hypothetical protein